MKARSIEELLNEKSIHLPLNPQVVVANSNQSVGDLIEVYPSILSPLNDRMLSYMNIPFYINHPPSLYMNISLCL